MEFRVARAARITGEILAKLVREELAEAKIKEPDCVICYGAGYNGPKPALNNHCNALDKMSQGIMLRRVLQEGALEIYPTANLKTSFPKLPCVARRFKHAKGKDMVVCRTPGAVRRWSDRRDYFTPVVDSDTEYRAWVYRKRILAVYEKRLTEPENNVKFGRNRANGFTFHALETEAIPEAVRTVAVAAVRALDLDFGAVDILGKYVNGDKLNVKATVLEVNSAPGVSDEHRSAIVRLKHRVVRWIANGCPGRTAE